MEGITEINKDDYIDNCLKIVKEMITEEDFSDEIWLALTGEIMDTCLLVVILKKQIFVILQTNTLIMVELNALKKRTRCCNATLL